MTADAVGGVWVYATELACSLCNAGNEVMLAVIGPRPRPDQIHPLHSVHGLELKMTDLLLEWMDPEGTDIARASEILHNIADAFDPDVLHLNSFREGNLKWPAPALIVAHSCVQTWRRACRSDELGATRWATYCDRVAAGLSAADAWVAPSAAFRDLISATYRPPAQGRVIRNGLTIAARPTAKQPFILAAGRLWDKAKNLSAIAAIGSELPWPVRVAGETRGPDGGDAKAACAQIKSLGALPRPALLDEMRDASIFVSPALYEPFGLTVLEAAASRCALVLSDLPSFRELWDDAALFVDPHDRNALRTALLSVCRDEALRARLQAKARMRARRYSQRAMAGAYLRLYREITAAPMRVPPPCPPPLVWEEERGARQRRIGARGMKVVLFCQSIVSCWNNGHAHFLRGITRELLRLGAEVVVYEPKDGWSRMNAVRDGGAAALAEAAALVSGAAVRTYDVNQIDLDQATDGADMVIVQEWNAPELIAAIGRHRVGGARYTLLFHDSHHRSVTAPGDLDSFDLDGYDGVLAFGEVIRQIYLKRGWTQRAFTWHEAADTTLFQPPPPYPPPFPHPSLPRLRGRVREGAGEGREVAAPQDTDLIWIGNWGDDERSRELTTYLIEPAAALRLRTRIHGVRYPDEVRTMLAGRGIAYAGWLPNHRAPEAYARARVTVHIPRRPYCDVLRGIPTIRVFEAMACGIPLICSPWRDEERLFPEGAYIGVATQSEMSDALSRVLRDQDLAQDLIATGLRAIGARHTCAHRVRQLLSIVEQLGGRTVWEPRVDAASARQLVPQ